MQMIPQKALTAQDYRDEIERLEQSGLIVPRRLRMEAANAEAREIEAGQRARKRNAERIFDGEPTIDDIGTEYRGGVVCETRPKTPRQREKARKRILRKVQPLSALVLKGGV